MRSAFEPLTWIRKHLLLSVLLFGYLVMSALIYEQGRVIDNQRTLIRDLFGDSAELSARKIHDLRDLNEHRKLPPANR
jgi:hypothetical protein